MAIESLTSIPLRTPAKDFSLPNVVTGETISLSKLPHTEALVIMFICRHCPYVVHVRDEILRIARQYQPKGVSFVAICSNDFAAYPDDSPEKLREMAIEHDFRFRFSTTGRNWSPEHTMRNALPTSTSSIPIDGSLTTAVSTRARRATASR